MSKGITSNYMGMRNYHILSFGYVEVSGYNCVMTWMVAHFILAFERSDGKFDPRWMYTIQTTTKTSKPFLDNFRRPQMIDL